MSTTCSTNAAVGHTGLTSNVEKTQNLVVGGGAVRVVSWDQGGGDRVRYVLVEVCGCMGRASGNDHSALGPLGVTRRGYEQEFGEAQGGVGGCKGCSSPSRTSFFMLGL